MNLLTDAHVYVWLCCSSFQLDNSYYIQLIVSVSEKISETCCHRAFKMSFIITTRNQNQCAEVSFNYIRQAYFPVRLLCDRFTDISSAVSHRIYHNNLIYLWLQGERTLISWQLWYRVWPDIFVKFWYSIFYYVACTIIKRQIICRIHKEYTVQLMPCFSCSSTAARSFN